MQMPLWNELDSEPQSRWIANKQTAKTGFVNLAMGLLDGSLKMEPFLSGEGLSLEELRRLYPRPAVPGTGNGVTHVVCSDCGRDGSPLQLHMQGGWLCPLCHREFMVRMGYSDEYGRLLED